MTNEKSLKSIGNWIQSIYKVKDTETPVVLTGNKMDLVEERVIDLDAAHKIAQDHNMSFRMTSAKTGEGVPEMIKDVLEKVYIKKIRPLLNGATNNAT